MTEPALTPRRDMTEGYILDVVGATVPDAIRTADICIPQYRQSLQRDGIVILTQYNGNERAGDLRTEPPTLAACAAALETIKSRKDDTMSALGADLGETEMELKSDLARGERSFWNKRARALKVKLGLIADEQVTPEELLRAFNREDISLHAKAIPPEMKEAMETISRERRFQQSLMEESVAEPAQSGSTA